MSSQNIHEFVRDTKAFCGHKTHPWGFTYARPDLYLYLTRPGQAGPGLTGHAGHAGLGWAGRGRAKPGDKRQSPKYDFVTLAGHRWVSGGCPGRTRSRA